MREKYWGNSCTDLKEEEGRGVSHWRPLAYIHANAIYSYLMERHVCQLVLFCTALFGCNLT